MELFTTLGPDWANVIVAALAILGIQLVWRGLCGGADGERALLLRRTDMLSRIQGFRLTVFGLVLLGIAAAIVWQAQWLLLLALGIGFVEILEERAAPAHVTVAVPEAAANGLEHVNDNSPHCRLMSILEFTDRHPGRVIE